MDVLDDDQDGALAAEVLQGGVHGLDDVRAVERARLGCARAPAAGEQAREGRVGRNHLVDLLGPGGLEPAEHLGERQVGQ